MTQQVWVTNSLGGYMFAPNLSAHLRMAVAPMVRFRQFADIKDATMQGLHKGANFHWNVFSDLASQGGTLTETNTMPKSNFTITQGTLTINEFGQSVDYTGKLDNLSEQPIKEIIQKVLKRDCQRAFDVAVAAQFDAAPLRVVPTSGTSTTALTLTTNGTATLTNNVAMGKEHIKLISDLMKERNIPAYDNDDYYAIGWPSAFRQLKNDLETINQYTESGVQFIRNGEIGRYESTRFVEQTHIAKGSGMGTSDGAWANAKSDWVVFFGNDTVAEAIAIPEEIRGKIPGDSKLVTIH